MARWRLESPHYMMVPGTVYTYEEIDLETGRRRFKQYPVPLLVDPKDPANCNRDGECIVAYAGSEQSRFDIVFEGTPTPEMTPLDEEAEALTAEWRERWIHPVEALPANGGADQVEFLKELTSIMKGFAPSSALPATAGVSQEEFEGLKRQIAELQAAKVEVPVEAIPATESTPNRRRA